jgi:hypothetical protein
MKQPHSKHVLTNAWYKLINAQTIAGPLRDKPWYYGRLSREQSDLVLTEYGSDGDFLVRDSESNVCLLKIIIIIIKSCVFQPGDFSISLKSSLRNKHFWVHVETEGGRRQYKIGNRHFSNMDELIEHYTVQPIYTNDKTGEKLYLIQALPPVSWGGYFVWRDLYGVFIWVVQYFLRVTATYFWLYNAFIIIIKQHFHVFCVRSNIYNCIFFCLYLSWFLHCFFVPSHLPVSQEHLSSCRANNK